MKSALAGPIAPLTGITMTRRRALAVVAYARRKGANERQQESKRGNAAQEPDRQTADVNAGGADQTAGTGETGTFSSLAADAPHRQVSRGVGPRKDWPDSLQLSPILRSA